MLDKIEYLFRHLESSMDYLLSDLH